MFINRLLPDGETFTEGPHNAAANTSSLITGTVQLGPMAEAETAVAVAASRGVLEPLGIEVTDVDPGTEPHLEIVIVGSGWPFPAGYRSIAPFACGFRANQIGFVRGLGPGEDIAGAVAYSVGIFNGLEPTEVFGNCMTNSAGADCTFAADAPITTPRCNVTVKDQVAILRRNLGCP